MKLKCVHTKTTRNLKCFKYSLCTAKYLKNIPQADINDDDDDGTLMVLLQLNKNFVTSRRYNYCLKQTNKQKNVWSLLIGMCI